MKYKVEDKHTHLEVIAKVQELEAKRDRIQEGLPRANAALFQAKENRDNLLLALCGIDHQIEQLQQGQLPLDIDDDEI